MGNESINWDKLGFDYIKTDKRYLSHWRDGAWDAGTLTDDNVLHISEGSTALHYGQQCFEGLKAYRCKDGSINLFRPDQNAARMQRSCARLLAPGGLMIVATLNRTLKALALAKIGAEYVLRWVPAGTHDWNKFLKPDEIRGFLDGEAVTVDGPYGVVFNPLTGRWSESVDSDVNYMMTVVRQLA